MSSAASAANRPPATIGGPISLGGLALFVLPIFFVVLSFAHKYGIYELGGAGRSFVLFGMLISVMLTGMPISIALGLTVLIFIFTTTTISRQQYELARQRVDAAGLTDRIELLLEDYRDLNGQYDKLVSIEMIEAVGHDYYDVYFRKCGELLKPDGMMLLQGITIADRQYDRARRSVDFIQRYIFPGSCIPSVSALTSSVARASDLRLFHLDDIGPHYATTLRRWRDNLFANIDAVKALGYPDAFIRMWDFYFCYCEGGFAERAIGDVQMLLVKPGCRRAPVL